MLTEKRADFAQKKGKKLSENIEKMLENCKKLAILGEKSDKLGG